MITLLVVDDQSAVRAGLRMQLQLEPDFLVVGEAADGDQALLMAEQLQPDIVVMDVEMPGMDGIAAAEAVRNVCKRSRVVILSLHDGSVPRQRASQAGAAAFISKHECGVALQDAIRRAAGTRPRDET